MTAVPSSAIQSSKHALRQRVWDLLQARSAARDPDVHGRIPDFIGSAQAAEKLASVPAWKTAQVIKAVPDKAQLPVRARALSEGKLVYMAVPKLAELQPFYLLDPAHLTRPPDEAASSRIAARPRAPASSRSRSVARSQPVTPARSPPAARRWRTRSSAATSSSVPAPSRPRWSSRSPCCGRSGAPTPEPASRRGGSRAAWRVHAAISES
jgi:hypothetical protein